MKVDLDGKALDPGTTSLGINQVCTVLQREESAGLERNFLIGFSLGRLHSPLGDPWRP